jgi:Fe-S cluster assembly ATP-binding protein
VKRQKKKYTGVLPSPLLSREVNVGFSGGEKKLSELLQLLSLKPSLAIFDEIDSGLDIKNMKNLMAIIKKELINKNTGILFITHSGNILETLLPTTTAVLLDGSIVCQSKNYKEIIHTIKHYGYERCKKCPFLAH